MLSNLKAALAARGWRQADLAAAVRIHASMLSEIICARRQAPAELRAQIAALLEVDELWLFQHVRPRRVQAGRQDTATVPAARR